MTLPTREGPLSSMFLLHCVGIRREAQFVSACHIDVFGNRQLLIAFAPFTVW